MPSVKELREQAGEQIKELRQARDAYNQAKDEGKPASELEERKAKFAEVRGKLDNLYEQLDAETDADDMDKVLGDYEGRSKPPKDIPGRDNFDPDLGGQQKPPEDRDAPTSEDRSWAMHAWARRQCDLDLSKRHKEAVKKLRSAGVRLGQQLTFKLPDTRTFRRMQAIFRSSHPSLIGISDEDGGSLHPEFEKRAMSALEGSKGAFAVSQGFISQIEINQLAFSGMLQVADFLRTNHGNELPWPTADDTSNEGEIVGESQNVEGSTEPTLDRVNFHAYKSHTKMIKVPYELLEDWSAAIDFEQFIAQIIGERLGRHRNRLYTLGTGNNQPLGLIPAATQGRNPAALTGDEVIRLQYAVDEAYRMGAGYMMHDNIFLEVQLLKDGNSNYIHTPGLQQGARDRIRGYPRFNNTHMDSAVASGNKIMTFGQHGKYKVREVNQVRLKRFDELYGADDQVAFDAFFRHDGNLLDAGTAPVQYMEMQ